MTESIISRFDIKLDAGDAPVFKGGEVITGKLLIELREPSVINAVKLQMKGRAVWVNDAMKKDDIEKVLFDSDFTLLERPPGKPEPGHFTWQGNYMYSLPFECPLPKGCPTSYEGPYAFIRYFIRASVVQEDQEGKTHDYYVKRAFSIVTPSEGHLVVGEALEVQDAAVFGKCCCKGKLSASLSLPKTGYLPGEDVTGSLKIGSKHPKGILQNMEVRLVDRVRRVGSPEISATSPWRTLFYRRLEDDTTESTKSGIHINGIHLLKIPAVCPTTKGDFDSVTEEVHKLSPIGRLMESPSTATLRFRKKPFLRIEYAVQLSLGPFLLLEIPIDIGEHSTRDKSVNLQPFIAGSQPIEERDEAGKISVDGPYTYTPVYPYKEHVVSKAPETQVYTPTIPTIVEEPMGNGIQSRTETRQETVETTSGNPEENSVVTTTKTIVTHVDGNETKTMEETVVERDGETVRTIEETVLTEDGLEKHRLEQVTIDDDGNERVISGETERLLEEPEQLPEAIQEAHERIEELIEQQNEQEQQAEESGETPSDPTVTTELVGGEETIVSTEEHEENGVRTTKTTTVTRHEDGTETTMIQEHTSSHQEHTEQQ